MGTTLLPADFKDFLRSLNSGRIVDTLVDVPVILFNLKHLLANKRASGRLKDLVDVEHLR